MGRALQLRAELNRSLEGSGAKIGVNEILMKTAAQALAEHPSVNVSFADDHIRQFTREYRQREGDLRDLIENLQQLERETGDLENVLERLRALENVETYDDQAELERLQNEVLQGIKEFEFGLRREIQMEAVERLFLTGNEEVPAEFRKLVEEYYKALAKEPPPVKPPN